MVKLTWLQCIVLIALSMVMGDSLQAFTEEPTLFWGLTGLFTIVNIGSLLFLAYCLNNDK